MIIRIFFYILLATSCGACTHTSAVKNKLPSTALQESTAMNVTDNTDTFNPSTLDEYPDLTPEEMGKRFLKLLGSIDSIDELSLDYVHKVMQLPIKGTPSHSYDFSMYLPESDWSYIFSYNEALIDDTPIQERYKIISFEFNNPDSPDVDMSPVCGKHFDAYVAELKKMGFVIGPEITDIGSINHFEKDAGFIKWSIFRSSNKAGSPGLSGWIVEQSQKLAPNEPSHRACLKSIYISGVIKP